MYHMKKKLFFNRYFVISQIVIPQKQKIIPKRNKMHFEAKN